MHEIVPTLVVGDCQHLELVWIIVFSENFLDYMLSKRECLLVECSTSVTNKDAVLDHKEG